MGRAVGRKGLFADGHEVEGRLAGRLTAGELMEGRLVFGRAAGRDPPRLGPLGRLGSAFGADEGRAAGLPPPRLGDPPFNPASASRVDNNKAAAKQQEF